MKAFFAFLASRRPRFYYVGFGLTVVTAIVFHFYESTLLFASELLISIVCLIVGLAKSIQVARATRKNREAAVEVDRRAAIQEFEAFQSWTDPRRWPNLNREVSGFLLHDGEMCVALSEGVDHVQVRKDTHYEGRSGSVNIRLTRRVSYRTGGFAGRRVTTESKQAADRGSIYITDRRVVFAGAKEVVEVPLRKLADARADVGILELIVANRANPIEFRLSEAFRAPVIAGAAKLMAAVSNAK